MFQQHKFNTDTRCKRSRTLCPYTPELATRRVFGKLRNKQPDPELSGCHEVRDPQVGGLLGTCRPNAYKHG
jgi:hypothetical protein